MKKTLAVLVFITLGILMFFIMRVSQFYKKIYTPKNSRQSIIKPEKTTFNVLLLGYAGGTHEGTYLTDTMMLAHVDIKKKRALIVSLPRDIWVKVPTYSGDEFHSKINTLYVMENFPKQYPDIESKNLVNRAVSAITGLPIDYYTSIDFEGFKRAVDILGGIDVDIERGFEDTRYPVEGREKDLCGKEEKDLPDLEKIATESPELAFPCRYETISFPSGEFHMDGETALKFARSRYSKQDGGDFGRASRQQRFLEAVKEKVLSIGFLPKIVPLLDELEEHIETDIPADLMKKFLAEGTKSKEYKITSVVLTDNEYLKSARSDDGQFILIPEEGEDQWDRVKRWIKNTIQGITPTPTLKPTH